MSQRSDQVAGLLREAIQKVISKGLHDPRVKGLITVTRVTVSEDLRSATVYISVMPDQHRDLTMHGLVAASKHIRHEISNQLALRKTPELLFKPDVKAARQAAVLDALSKVANEPERAPEPWGAEPDANNAESANNPATNDPSPPGRASDDR
ncbi:MAG: 30S ribosome-binding factor RbfA [Planctomycetota bacterium]